MNDKLKQLQAEKNDLQNKVEILINEFRSKYENPKVDIFTLEVPGAVQLQIEIEVKF